MGPYNGVTVGKQRATVRQKQGNGNATMEERSVNIRDGLLTLSTLPAFKTNLPKYKQYLFFIDFITMANKISSQKFWMADGAFANIPCVEHPCVLKEGWTSPHFSMAGKYLTNKSFSH